MLIFSYCVSSHFIVLFIGLANMLKGGANVVVRAGLDLKSRRSTSKHCSSNDNENNYLIHNK